MRISVKGRYALASMTYLGVETANNKLITINEISQNLGISKIYLEQVFSLLKRAKLVTSTKGANGGYQLSKSINSITVYDILYAIEFPMFEKADQTVTTIKPLLEQALTKLVYEKLDKAVVENLKNTTLETIVSYCIQKNGNFMFYI